jgi:hypothetical protein
MKNIFYILITNKKFNKNYFLEFLNIILIHELNIRNFISIK